MKKSLQILAIAALLVIQFDSAAQAQYSYYWRGGNGNWNDPAKWDIRTPDPAPQSLPSPTPTINDDVFFEASSFPGNATVRLDAVAGIASATARNITFLGTSGTIMRNITFENNIPLQVAGSISVNSPSLNLGFLVKSPLTVGGNVTADSRLNLQTLQPVSITGSLTYNAGSAGSAIGMGNTLTVGGSVTINPAMTFQASHHLTIGGSLTLSPTMTLTTANNSSSRLTLTSSGPATINSGGKTFTMPVVFNGSADARWILQNEMNIGNGVQFVRGHVVALPLPVADPVNPNAPLPPFQTSASFPSTTPQLTFSNYSAIATGASAASHVIGYVKRIIPKAQGTNRDNGPTNFTFPVGDGRLYRPITNLGLSASDGELTARYVSVNPLSPAFATTPVPTVAPLNSVSDKEFWYFNSTMSSAPGFRVSYDHPDDQGYYHPSVWGGITVAALKTSNIGNDGKTNAVWEQAFGGSAVSPTDPLNPRTVSFTSGNNNTAWYTIGRRGSYPLPVRLVSFTGQYVDGQVQLKWQSASEENTAHFVVEKSTDGKNFSQVLTRKAQGNSSSLVSYSAVDQNPFGGLSYYRLRMVDLDGTFAYSKMVTVNAQNSGLQVRAYPNPSKGSSIHLAADNGQKMVLVSVSDMFGKPVQFQAGNVSADGICVNFARSLPAGFYIATLATDDDKKERIKVKFVVQ